MADISLYDNDIEDGLNDGADDLGFDDGSNPDEDLSPIQRLEKYMDSENIFSRQMVARSLLETMRIVGDNSEDANTVLKAMVKLSEDLEPTVRGDLMEQVPHLAVFCQEARHLFTNPIPTYILPVVVRYLTDSNNQVRKTSQAALLVLLEQELVEKSDVEEQVCPVILQLSSTDSLDDFRTEAVALMSKMAPLVGRDITVRLFLPRFAEMCTDPLFHVRKVCAANFGEMCGVVGQENTEEYLLPKFFYLCEDGVWGVRKACAECFMAVSCACSLEVRRKELATLFISLICDQSRWVRMASFQALGSFISTFADPGVTGLYFDEDGVLIAGNPDDFQRSSSEEELSSPTSETPSNCDDVNQTTQSKGSSLGPDPLATGDGPNQSKHSDDKNVPVDMEIDVDDELKPQKSFTSEGAKENEDSSKPVEVSVEESRAEKYSQKVDANDNSELSSQPVDSAAKTCDELKGASDEKQNVTSSDNISDNNANVSNTNSSNKGSPAEQDTVSDSDSSKAQENSKVQDSSKDETSFDSFHFWRTPLPEIDINLDGIESEGRSPSPDANDLSRKLENVYLVDLPEDGSNGSGSSDSVRIHTASVNEVNAEVETVANIGTTHIIGQQVNETAAFIPGTMQDSNEDSVRYADDSDYEDELQCPPQDVIPQALLDHYLSMTNPDRAQTVDTEIARHCAYSLPAVAYTLGRKHWPCIRTLYETLAADMQWKVRRTLAFSIHELAIILGEDITVKDLVPVFNGFLRDLDEVRIGVLKHFADFVKLLTPEVRKEYLGKVADFLNTDNCRNWRFREDLGHQLLMMAELYSAGDLSDFLVPVAMKLAEDKVNEVRQMAFHVLSGILKRLSEDGDGCVVLAFVNDVIEKFGMSNKWSRRQTFAQLCHHILNEKAVSNERFAKDLLPTLLALGKDPIPNVRISLAKTVALNLEPNEYFTSPENPHHEDLMNLIESLKEDSDRDVRYFVCNQHHQLITEDYEYGCGDDSIPV